MFKDEQKVVVPPQFNISKKLIFLITALTGLPVRFYSCL